MSSRTRRFLNYAFILGTLAVVLYIGLSSNDLGAALDALRQLQPAWLIGALLCMAMFVLSDAFSVWYFLRKQGYRVRPGTALFVGIAGTYYSNITPGATGGQPMQVYYLHKEGVPVGIATSALVVKFFCFQCMLSVICGLLWFTQFDWIMSQVGASKWLLIIGFTYNTVMIIAVLLMAINKRFVAFLLRKGVNLLSKMHILKNPENAHVKVMSTLDSFHSSVMMLRRSPKDFVAQLLMGAFQLLVQMAVTYCIYEGFGLSGVSFLQIISLAVMLYTSAAYTPMPGASGAQEGVFALYFGQVFPDGTRLMGLLLWRFFTYYLGLLVGAVVTTVHGLRKKKEDPEIEEGEENKA